VPQSGQQDPSALRTFAHALDSSVSLARYSRVMDKLGAVCILQALITTHGFAIAGETAWRPPHRAGYPHG